MISYFYQSMDDPSCRFFRELTVGKLVTVDPVAFILHITRAEIIPPTSSNVVLSAMIDGNLLTMGTLSPSNGVYHLPLNKSFMPNSEVDFFMKGDTNAKVQLTGYYEAVRPPSATSPAALLRQLISSVVPSWAYVRQGRQAESCSICSQSLRKGTVVRQLKCGHIFHAQCIDEWLKKSFTCGYCRQALIG